METLLDIVVTIILIAGIIVLGVLGMSFLLMLGILSLLMGLIALPFVLIAIFLENPKK